MSPPFITVRPRNSHPAVGLCRDSVPNAFSGKKPRAAPLLVGPALFFFVVVRFGAGRSLRANHPHLDLGCDVVGETDRGYRVSDIARIAGDLAGKDLSELFDRYVEGQEIIPLAPSLKRIGLELKWTGSRASIRNIRNPDAEALRLRRFILGDLQ